MGARLQAIKTPGTRGAMPQHTLLTASSTDKRTVSIKFQLVYSDHSEVNCKNRSIWLRNSVSFPFSRFCASTNLSKSWFEKIILANRACGGGIVAWKGTNQTDAPRNRYGAYISNSVIMRVRIFGTEVQVSHILLVSRCQ